MAITTFQPNPAFVRWALASLLFASGSSLLAGNEDGPADASEGREGPSTTALLIQRLAKNGALKHEDAEELLMMAEADAQELKAQKALAEAAVAQAAAAKARARLLELQLARQGTEGSSGAKSLAVETPRLSRSKPRTPVQTDDLAINQSPLPSARVEPRVPQVTLESSSPTISPAAPLDDDTPSPRVARTVLKPVPREGEETDGVKVKSGESVEVEPTPIAVASPVPEPLAEVPREELDSEEPETVPPDEVRVRYVPEAVRRQIKEELRQEVMAQAREEGWAAPRAYPSWVDRLSFYGDFRFRVEGSYMPSENVTGQSSSFWNFNAINSSSTPYDITGDALPPYANSDEDRTRVRVRARLGLNADLSEGFTGGLRFATGESNSPVSQNQTLGAAGSGQGGNFSKLALWLDRAFLRYEVGGMPDETAFMKLGRFERPYWGTSMVWADDLGFDGLAVQAKRPLGDSAIPFLNLGAHPVFNTDLNFGTTSSTKFKSRDKWLLASQLGAEIDLAADVTAKMAVSYYHYENVEGEVSPEVLPLAATDSFAADASRPSFAQRGNTYIALRNIKADTTANGNGTSKQWQYFGLATPFRELAGNFELNVDVFQPFRITVFGEYVKNLAFDRDEISGRGPATYLGPVNNNATVISSSGSTTEVFGGSATAWNAGVRFGAVSLQKRWDWNASLSYRNVGSDALVDAFADSDFGGGGTNQKGFVFGGNLGLSRSVSLGLRWMSADQKAGPTPVKNDIIQVDVNGSF